MLLAIDIGNTNTVFALFGKDGDLIENWRMQTQAMRTVDEYGVFVQQLLNLDLKTISDVIVSSVVPEANRHIQGFCQKYIEKACTFVSKDSVPVAVEVDRPEDVGADRLVNAAAVVAHYPQYKEHGAVVIDFGTATTFDVISADGAYAGGVIAPGINLSINALHQAASKLPKVSVSCPDNVIGKTTVQAMHSGIYNGYKGLIEGVVSGICDELGGKPFVLATGGLAPLFAEDSAVIQTVDQELTLKGLYEIHKSQNS